LFSIPAVYTLTPRLWMLDQLAFLQISLPLFCNECFLLLYSFVSNCEVSICEHNINVANVESGGCRKYVTLLNLYNTTTSIIVCAALFNGNKTLYFGRIMYIWFSKIRGGLIIFGFIKKTRSYRIEKKMYLLYIFSPELHPLMTSLF
jgi:hypothetical protein